MGCTKDSRGETVVQEPANCQNGGSWGGLQTYLLKIALWALVKQYHSIPISFLVLEYSLERLNTHLMRKSLAEVRVCSNYKAGKESAEANEGSCRLASQNTRSMEAGRPGVAPLGLKCHVCPVLVVMQVTQIPVPQFLLTGV